ncbi:MULTISPECIES: Lrp/AsnC family transcriptional regulator [Nocardiopsis]|uniref:Transcriptional regulator, AsnC family n=1 Tax=Nocardiopsis dassonvillei (strain ATCC 23218 / DSM 43111 / CIP 107115 / JCM 7437 / KCTC 9190 / NBRC 14626 / NCTC 10488 / NRRL B-5397 / IMRU 509) TaxID=446468 RepID=D7B3C4_NOCDD|nr:MULTISPECIES: Lrp/AsnC family transcriptional regulator [Nocardiopsis]ADH66852.1 putative transcriptional regulator, AsnC family [Nocardiopsis dassonvillei subsp. dassonvillei DSM 43111]APC35122.1 AsnC family protein [Nocardiopsis dassonvillei]ASU57958.1 Lrp/AsnC family transcriptional regulator [Nocardiopsis dassonvillei]NKY82244.1 Lrp/AsnC family transcriptional regulator [Nocardiopsis dassonvillei]VEI86552.1 leucine-responsive transcriptional regulator [Nocardiopsis dassonvillei]
MLDAVDTALMRALQGDGRATFQALADGVGLSRTAVRARVRQLVQSGAIRIVGVLHAGVVGMEVLSHVSFRVSGPVGPMLDALGEREAVTFAAHSAGRFPAVAQVRVADDAALTKELSELRALPGVDGAEVFRANSVFKDAHSSVRELRDIELDALDWRLVRQLLRDGRSSYADLARQVGLSQAAARSRVVRLLDSGVVHVTALVEPTAVGANERLGFGLRCRGDAELLGAALANMPRISFLASGFGRYDVIGTLTAPDRCQLVEALEGVRATPGVGYVESWDHLSVRKERKGGDRPLEWVAP